MKLLPSTILDMESISEKEIFNRSRLLLGDRNMRRIEDVRVIIFGVGGVGSWCAESLIRSGVRMLTIVDSDRVSVSNINRQLMATVATVGKVKVEALKDHLLKINPYADIQTHQEIYSVETADSFCLDEYDYVVDAIDSLKNKVLLIERATASKAKLFSSMGAALKMDPTRIKVAEFWNVKGCPLARALRQRFKKIRRFPKKKFQCVYSDELLPNLGNTSNAPTTSEIPNPSDNNSVNIVGQNTWDATKAQINGSLHHITSIFGITIAGLIIKDITK